MASPFFFLIEKNIFVLIERPTSDDLPSWNIEIPLTNKNPSEGLKMASTGFCVSVGLNIPAGGGGLYTGS